MALSWIHSE